MPTSGLPDAAQRAGRRRASIKPRDQRRAGTPQCRRLQLHHARGSSGAPALGQAARSRQRRRRCSTSSRCLRAAAAQLTSSATTRLVRSPPRICGTRLAWWTSPLFVCSGWWCWCLVGWVTARKEIVGRLPTSQNLGKRKSGNDLRSVCSFFCICHIAC